MKRLALPAALALLCALQPPNTHAVNYESYNGFTVSEDPVLPAKEVHPSLWFRAEDLPAMRARRDGDEHSRKLWQDIVNDPLLKGPLPTLPPKNGEKEAIRRYYGAMPQIAALHGLQYQMSEEPALKEKHLAAGREALMRLFDGYVYELDPKPRGSAGDEIYHALWMQNAAAAYDWLQPALTPEEDAKVRAILKKEGAFIRAGLDDWADRPHNHLSKPAWGLGTLALALNSEPEAADWLNYALSRANKNTKYFFSADGIYREGSMYFIFSAINFVPFLHQYKTVSGVDHFDEWQPAFEWPIAVRNGKGWMPNHEDAWFRPFFSEIVAQHYRGVTSRFSDEHDFASILKWNFRNTDYTPFEAIERQTGFNYTGASYDYNLAMTEFLLYDPTIEPKPPTVSPTIFLDGGQTVFRSDWNYNDPRTRYLVFQGVAESDNHEHYEHLSFLIQAENQLMASDSGYSRASFGEPIRREWYVTPEAHNVVMVDGAAPVDPAENVTPTSRHRIDTDWFDMEEKEAPYAAGGRLRRAIAFLGNTHFVVLDRVSLPETRTVTAVLHGGRGKLAMDGSHSRWTYEADIYGPAATMDVWTLPAGLHREAKEGEVTYIKGDWALFPYTLSTVRAQETAIMQVIVPSGSAIGAPKVAERAGSGGLTMALELADGTTETILSAAAYIPATGAAAVRSGKANSGAISTDAALAVVRQRGDKVLWVGVMEGSSLRVGDRELLPPGGGTFTGTMEFPDDGSTRTVTVKEQ